MTRVQDCQPRTTLFDIGKISGNPSVSEIRDDIDRVDAGEICLYVEEKADVWRDNRSNQQLRYIGERLSVGSSGSRSQTLSG